ncbi:hypothetical protein P2318_21780 [Myxococcaceae bacterium GXIMD 01537]
MLLGLLLVSLPLDASAQSVNVPATKNPHLRKIASLYETLDYEDALRLVPKAAKHPGNKEQEHLWLELMTGVLLYGLNDTIRSDAAFVRALEKAPYTSLPLLNPSQTLYQRFDGIRRSVLQARDLKQEARIPQATPSAIEAPATAPLDATTVPTEPASIPSEPARLESIVHQHVDAAPGVIVSADELAEMLRALATRAARWDGTPSAPALTLSIENLQRQIRTAATPIERKELAATIDSWFVLLAADKQARVLPPKAEPRPDAADGSPLFHAISREVLEKRSSLMFAWLLAQAEPPSQAQLSELLGDIIQVHRLNVGSETSHERMQLAIRLDRIELRMHRTLGWYIQGSAVRSAAP